MTELGDKLRALSESSRTEYAKRRAAFNITCRQDELRFERKEADESGMMNCCHTTRDELFDAYDAEITRLRAESESRHQHIVALLNQDTNSTAIIHYLRAELAAKDAEIEKLKRVCGEVYQVIGFIWKHKEDEPMWSDDDLERVLDNLSDASNDNPISHDDLLPWPKQDTNTKENSNG